MARYRYADDARTRNPQLVDLVGCLLTGTHKGYVYLGRMM
jgi:hypothetical protein